mmetsp:Transcript_9666/g.16179  ORF Transcript_9666/g.16179 Transcript_9666/m.16179 type:complete len:203 (+) Transcript_9666:57-665(+)
MTWKMTLGTRRVFNEKAKGTQSWPQGLKPLSESMVRGQFHGRRLHSSSKTAACRRPLWTPAPDNALSALAAISSHSSCSATKCLRRIATTSAVVITRGRCPASTFVRRGSSFVRRAASASPTRARAARRSVKNPLKACVESSACSAGGPNAPAWPGGAPAAERPATSESSRARSSMSSCSSEARGRAEQNVSAKQKSFWAHC